MNATERFLSKVRKDASGCWVWTGSTSGSGYGQFWDGSRNIPAHHFLLVEAQKKRHEGFEACHTCDNKLCVRPSHIFWGTRSDNMIDCRNKGRLRPKNGCAAMLRVRKLHYGEDNHAHKLTAKQVDEIKRTANMRGMQARLARRFGVSESLVSGIRRGVRWVD